MSTKRINVKTFLGTAAFAVVLMSTSGCTNSRESLGEDTGNEVVYENVADIPGAYVKDSEEVRKEKEGLRAELNQQLDKVDEKIEAVEDKAKSLSASAQQEYQQVIDRLDVEREKLVAEYKTIENATDDTWQDVKSEVKGIMQEVDTTVTELTQDLED